MALKLLSEKRPCSGDLCLLRFWFLDPDYYLFLKKAYFNRYVYVFCYVLILF